MSNNLQPTGNPTNPVMRARNFKVLKTYFTPDFTYVKPNGETFTGTAAVDAIHRVFALFTESHIQPVYGTLAETVDGYRLTGWSHVFGTLPGVGEKKHVDLDGTAWDCVMKGAIDISYVKDPEGPEGFRMKAFEMFADFSPVVGEAIKRGVIPVGVLMTA